MGASPNASTKSPVADAVVPSVRVAIAVRRDVDVKWRDRPVQVERPRAGVSILTPMKEVTHPLLLVDRADDQAKSLRGEGEARARHRRHDLRQRVGGGGTIEVGRRSYSDGPESVEQSAPI